jgi:hypothetical protein
MKRLLGMALLGLVLVLAACNTACPEPSLTVQDFGTSSADLGFGVAALPTGVGAVVVDPFSVPPGQLLAAYTPSHLFPCFV